MLKDMDRRESHELLDATDLPDETVAQSYNELSKVNSFLGNTAAVLRLLRQADPAPRRVLDIGCGHGALLIKIRKELGVDVVGMDLRQAPPEATISIVAGNAVIDPLPRADVTVCVLVAHHLSEVDLDALIRNVAQSSRRFILLDLVRHPAPLWLFRLFVAPWLNHINRRDGQTSIIRAYTAAEMRRIVDQALTGAARPVEHMRHTVAPFWIRQVVDIQWEPSSLRK
jgi:SAM-dependent methyltransferase